MASSLKLHHLLFHVRRPSALSILSLKPSPLPLLHLPKKISTTTNTISSSSSSSVRARKREEESTRRRVARRTRSEKEFDEAAVRRYVGGGEAAEEHVPVMLGEVLEVFRPLRLRAFVDCTLGAGGHSSAIIQAHPEMHSYIGLDVDPIAHEQAQARINSLVHNDACGSTSDLKVLTFLKNYRDVKHVLHEVDEELANHGVDGILMDLGMSSMQVNNAERGFSVLSDGPLDMRMNPQGHGRRV